MSGKPWERYQKQEPAQEPAQGPWTQYQKRETEPTQQPQDAASVAQDTEDPQQQQQAPKKSWARQIAEHILYNPIVQGVTDIPAGVVQAAAHLPGMPQKAGEWADHMIADRDKAFRELPMNQTALASINRGIAGAAPTFLIPGMGAARGANFVSKLTHGVATGGAAAAVQPVEVQDGQNYGSEKAKQMAAGAAIGGALPIAGAGVRLAKKGISKALVGTVDPAAAARVAQLGEEYGVRMTAGDISGNAGAKKVETQLENLPLVGMGKYRLAQNQEAANASKMTAAKFMESMKQMGFDSIDDVQRVADAGGKRSKEARSLLASVANAGDDWKLLLQTSGNMKAFGHKLRADELYNKIDVLSQPFGNIPTKNTDQVLASVKADLSTHVLPDKPTKNLLSEIENGLSNAGADRSYAGLRRLRSSLSSKISDYYRGANSVVGAEGVGVLERLKTAIESDMDDFAKNATPDLRTAWKNADIFYKEKVVPFKTSAQMATALKSESPEKLVKMYLSPGDGYAKNKMVAMLDSKGQASLRAGILDEAMQAATNPAQGAQSPTFSPARFAAFLEKHEESVKAAFSGEEKWKLDGLKNLMRHVERSGQFAENPPTGNRALQLISVGGLSSALTGLATGNLAEGVALPVVGWAGAKTLKELYTSPAGKRLLLQASASTPGSAAMDRLISRAPAMLGQATAKPTKKD